MGLGLTVTGASATWAGAAALAHRVVTAQDIFALKHADDVQISPDGRHVAFVQVAGDVATDRNRSTVWMVELLPLLQREQSDGGSTASLPDSVAC